MTDQCPLCCLEWHGLPANEGCPEQGCPSVYGTEEQITKWKNRIYLDTPNPT